MWCARTAVLGVLGTLILLCCLAQRLTRSNGQARNAALAWNAIGQWVGTSFKCVGSISEPLP